MSQDMAYLQDAEIKLRLIELIKELVTEKHPEKLLIKILAGARELTRADAGTLYTVDGDKLLFRVFQNATMKISYSSASNVAMPLEPVPIEESNVSGFVAKTGLSVNVADVYENDEFDFSGPRKYDATTGYKSKSMLVVPLLDKAKKVIGVLQLLNSMDPISGEAVPFPTILEELATSFAVHASETLEEIGG